MTRTHIVAALTLALAACGGLDTPDLSVASVEGRIVGAAPGAFAYPLGRPDLRVEIGADGRYAFERIAVATGSLVLVDGVVAGEARARLVPLRLSGGDRTSVADEYGEYAGVADGTKMPLASRVYATARVRNGALVAGARFAVAGTHLADVATQPVPLETVAELWPVPAGLFDVAAVLGGYTPGLAPDVDVPVAQSIDVEVDLDVDEDDDAPGCLTTGCRGGLDCEDDGFCYECDDDSDCASGRCDGEVHTCRADPASPVDACAACDPSVVDACGAGNLCLPTGGASGYCTRTCADDADCPSGLACREPSPGTRACLPLRGCAEYLATFGASCLKDEACSEGLNEGECQGRTAGDPKPGFCTARCEVDGDCPASLGYTCSHVESGTGDLFCAPPPP